MREDCTQNDSSIDELVLIVEQLCINKVTVNGKVTKFYSFYIDNGDQCASQVGALTTEIASKLNISSSKARYRLKKLVQTGRLIGHQFHSGSTIAWWPVGLCDKLKSIKNEIDISSPATATIPSIKFEPKKYIC